MKKLISLLLVVVIMFNFIWITPVYAETPSDRRSDSSAGLQESETDPEMQGALLSNAAEGETIENTENNFRSAVAGTVMGIITTMINVIPLTFEILMTAYTTDEMDVLGNIGGAFTGTNTADNYFTVYRTVFNEIGAFNIDYFNFDSSYTVGDKTIQVPSGITSLKQNIAKWFYILRIISVAVALLVLIYVGIRMALASAAEDKAVYKKMLISWVESLIILFLLHYIIIFMLELGKILEGIALSLKNNLESADQMSFEQTMVTQVANLFYKTSNSTIINNTLYLWCLFLMHARFFLLYIKRFFMTGFLILISPLITITYPVDKMGDNKAQAFSAWFRELIISVTIQPIHAYIYLVLGFTAGKIMQLAPMLSLILLMLISQAEQVVRKIFTVGGGVVVSELDKEGPGGKKK